MCDKPTTEEKMKYREEQLAEFKKLNDKLNMKKQTLHDDIIEQNIVELTKKVLNPDKDAKYHTDFVDENVPGTETTSLFELS